MSQLDPFGVRLAGIQPRRRNTDAVGIWHETYRVTAGQWETIDGGKKKVGLLGAASGHTLLPGSTSPTRIGDLDTDKAPVEAPSTSPTSASGDQRP